MPDHPGPVAGVCSRRRNDGVAGHRLARRHLAWLCRPINAVCTPQRDGGWFMGRPPMNAVIDHFLALHDRWSDEVWRRFDSRPGSFERWVSDITPRSILA
jgi:hypothetical protein